VFPIPGANAALAALIASGLLGTDSSRGEDTAAFTFHGFLPAKEGQRRTALEALAQSGNDTTQIFYEAPHRILATLADVEAVFGPGQHIVLARELTKLHEEFLRGAVAELRKSLSERASIKGEFVLLFTPAPAPQAISGEATSAQPQFSLAAEVRALMRAENMSEMDALKRVARARGLSKSAAYREWQRSKSSKPAR